MALTLTERRALDRLYRKQRDWRWLRYVGLIAGAGLFVAAYWLELYFTEQLAATTRHMSATEPLTGIEVFFASQYGGLLGIAHLVPVIGATIIGIVIGRWRGNPLQDVLLRVLEGQSVPTEPSDTRHV